jgi:hypothetical protein
MEAEYRTELARELSELGQRFWAISRQFWSQPRRPEDQVRWLKLQCFKEMYGSGLHANPDGIIRGLIDQLRDGIEGVETKEGRNEYERNIRVLREEITHYR